MDRRSKNKTLFNYLLQLSWLLEGSIRNAFPSSFYCSIIIRCIVFIALAKIREHKGCISPSNFYGQLPNYQSQVLAYSTKLMSSLSVSVVPSHQTYKTEAGQRYLVCVECLQMIKQMVVDFCWALWLLWTFDVDFESTCTV